MLNQRRRPVARASLAGKALLIAVLTSGLPGGAAMATPPENLAEKPSEGERSFSKVAGEYVNNALNFMNAYHYASAKFKLEEALALPDLNPYEKSTIYQMLGSVYFEMNDYDGAIQAFENAIAAGGLLPNEAISLRLNIAQLYIASGQNRKGAILLEGFIAEAHPVKPQYIDMLVGAWMQAEDYQRALPWAERWFEQANPKERKHFDLLNFLYNALGMKAQQAAHIEAYKKRFPEAFSD